MPLGRGNRQDFLGKLWAQEKGVGRCEGKEEENNREQNMNTYPFIPLWIHENIFRYTYTIHTYTNTEIKYFVHNFSKIGKKSQISINKKTGGKHVCAIQSYIIFWKWYLTDGKTTTHICHLRRTWTQQRTCWWWRLEYCAWLR